MISEQGIKKFIELYENKYSVKLTDQEAFDMFSKLIQAIRTNPKQLID